MIGTRLGPYEITAKLGEGGMGEVWRATDTRLKREVAIKVLPSAFTEDHERLARFEREAQLLAQLHHPHIASIFGLEEAGVARALVMELVEGPTLDVRLANGALPLQEALGIAHQIAEALEAAHEKGIVHRDLKPQNIKAAVDGTVKVLDFGLAKALDPATGSATAADLARSPTIMNSPTLTAAGTQLGVILGTAAYMAPEQARGGAADKRADIWAFGVVFYEMLAGRSLFSGPTVSDTLAGVLKTDIDWSALPASTPPALRSLLRRCLERNPKNRLHDIADARLVIDDLLAGRVEPGGALAAAGPARGRRWPYLAGGFAALFGLALGLAMPWRPWSKRASPPPALRLEIPAPSGTTFGNGLALSPDGTTLAFVARGAQGRLELWVRRLDSREARRLPGTEGARYPFWAPDGKRLAFFADAHLQVTDLLGTPRSIAATSSTSDVRGGSWGADDTILFTPTFTGGLMRVSAGGGETGTAVPLPPGGRHGTYRFPHFLPDGRRFVFYAALGTGVEPGELYLGKLGSPEIKRLGDAHSAAVFAPPDRLLYVKGDQLVAQHFDLTSESLAGDPEPLGVNLPGGAGISAYRSLSLSRTGILAVRADQREVTHPVWVDQGGKLLGAIAPDDNAYWYAPRLAPDGRNLLIARYGVGAAPSGDIWIYDLERQQGTRRTFDEGDEQVAVWSPDIRTIAFSSARSGGAYGIYLTPADRQSEARLWYQSDRYMFPSFFTADGKELIYEQLGEDQQSSLWRAAIDGPVEPRAVVANTGAEFAPALSRDGRFLAFSSDATRSSEVYVRALNGGETVRVSTAGGGQPLWRPDGRALFYIAPNGMLMTVEVESDEPRRYGAPRALFDAHLEDSPDRQYDVAPDGKRFLLNQRAGSDSEPIVVITGWEGVARR